MDISFADTYGAESGLQSACRNIALTETGLQVRDSFVFSGLSNTLTENFITPLLPAVTEKGVLLGEKFLLTVPTSCHIQIDRQEIAQDKKLFADWKTEALYRLRVGFECENTWKGTFTLQVV